MIRKGRELAVKFNDTKVGLVLSATLSIDGNTIDISNDDSGDWNEYLKGRNDWQIDLTVIRDETEAQQTAIVDNMINSGDNGTIDFGPDAPTTDDVNYTGEVIVTNFEVSKSGSDERVESNFSFQGSGPLTRSVAI